MVPQGGAYAVVLFVFLLCGAPWLLATAESQIKTAPLIRVNLSDPFQVFVHWENTSAWAQGADTTVVVKASVINNFPLALTQETRAPAADGVVDMRLSSSAFVAMYYFAIGVVPTSSAAISDGEFSPITGKWVVAGDCSPSTRAPLSPGHDVAMKPRKK